MGIGPLFCCHDCFYAGHIWSGRTIYAPGLNGRDYAISMGMRSRTV